MKGGGGGRGSYIISTYAEVNASQRLPFRTAGWVRLLRTVQRGGKAMSVERAALRQRSTQTGGQGAACRAGGVPQTKVHADRWAGSCVSCRRGSSDKGPRRQVGRELRVVQEGFLRQRSTQTGGQGAACRAGGVTTAGSRRGLACGSSCPWARTTPPALRGRCGYAAGGGWRSPVPIPMS